MKHTQGEWKATRVNNGAISHVITANAVIVAHVNDLPNTFGDNEANARLISASKDLLEALERLLKEARQNSFNANGNLSDTPAEAAAMAAINKATGKDVKLFTPPNYSIEQE